MKPDIRCSSLNQLIECPGSLTILRKIGLRPDDDGQDSWDGQHCHFEGATRFVKRHGAAPPEGGLVGPRIPKTYVAPKWADWVIDFYERTVLAEVPGDWAMAVEDSMKYELGSCFLSGHPDVYALSPDMTELRFFDCKAGTNPIDPAECNWQLFGYTVLFKLAFPGLRRVVGYIIQPRIAEELGKRVSYFVVDENGVWGEGGAKLSDLTIDNVVETLDRRIAGALCQPWTLNTGIKQCRWCEVELDCPALRKYKNTMKHEMSQAELDAIKTSTDDDTLIEWAIAKKVLEPKLKAAWERLKARMEAQSVTSLASKSGAKAVLMPWKGKRELSDKGKVTAWESLAAEVPEAAAYECMELSIGTMERTYAKVLDIPISTKKEEKNSGEKEVKRRFGEFITQAEGKQLTLVE